MPNTESEVIQIILKNGGKAKKRDIVKKLGISLGYLDIITHSLERRGLVRVNNNVYFLTLLGKKKLAEFIQKTPNHPAKAGATGQAKKIELRVKKKRGRPRRKWRPKEQKANLPVTEVNGQLTNTDGEMDSAKESPTETLLGQRIDELKEGMAKAEEKIEEGVKNIEDKIEKELEKKIETVEEKAGPIVEKTEELPPIILRFGSFLFFTSKKIFNKFKKIKNVKFPKFYKSHILVVQQKADREKLITKASLVFVKLRDYKVRDKLIFLPVWISKNYKNLTKKKS